MTREMAKANLKANWAELVSSRDMDLEELVGSLEDQINGYEDLSLDELTEEMAETLGWEFGDLTDEQVDEWKEIVNKSAEEYLASIGYIVNEQVASRYVADFAGTHNGLYCRDMEALYSLGEADCETIFGGYLWEAMEEELGDMDEETEEMLSMAIINFYVDALGL